MCDPDHAIEIRQDPAVCVSLPSNSIVKEQNREQQPARRRTARFSRRQRPYRMFRLGTSEFRWFDALRGRRSSDARQRRSFKQQRRPGVNTSFKISSSFRQGRDEPNFAAQYQLFNGTLFKQYLRLKPKKSFSRPALTPPSLLPNLDQRDLRCAWGGTAWIGHRNELGRATVPPGPGGRR